MPNITTEASLTTKIKVWLETIPWITRIIFLACILVYVWSSLVGFSNFKVCTSPDRMLNSEGWRIFTSPFFHGNLLHLGFNMMAYLGLGTIFERERGSAQTLWLINYFIFLNGVFHFVAAVIGFGQLGYKELLTQCSVGFSGVLFSLITVSCYSSTQESRSLFGLVNVPAKLYPWALLIVYQVLLPRISFLGHLSGLLTGFFYSYGANTWMDMDTNYCQLIDSKLSSLSSGWITCPSGGHSLPVRGEGRSLQ